MRIREDMAPVLTRWALPLPLRFEGSLLPRRTLSSAPLHSPRLWCGSPAAHAQVLSQRRPHGQESEWGPELSRSGKSERAETRTWGQTTRGRNKTHHTHCHPREGRQSQRLVRPTNSHTQTWAGQGRPTLQGSWTWD